MCHYGKFTKFIQFFLRVHLWNEGNQPPALKPSPQNNPYTQSSREHFNKNLYATTNFKAKRLSRKTLGDVNDRHQFLNYVALH